MRRHVAWMAAAASLLVGWPITTAAATASRHACAAVTTAGGWTTVHLPTYSENPSPAAPTGQSASGLSDVVAIPTSPRTLIGVSANRQLLRRSADGGCTWTTVLDLGAIAPAAAGTSVLPTYSIVDLVTTPVPGHRATPRLTVLADEYAVNTATLGFIAMPILIVSSRDGGATWSRVSPSLPSTAPICADWEQLAVAPSDPDRLYFDCPPYIATNQQTGLWTSPDGGRTWTSVNDNPPIGLVAFTNKAMFAVDPRDPRTLYSLATPAGAGTDSSFNVSTDGGTTWKRGWHRKMDLELAGFSVVHPAHHAALLTMWMPGFVCASTDAGATADCEKAPVTQGVPGIIEGARPSRSGRSIVVLAGYNGTDEFGGCADQRLFTLRPGSGDPMTPVPAAAASPLRARKNRQEGALVGTDAGRFTVFVVHLPPTRPPLNPDACSTNPDVLVLFSERLR